MKKTPHLIMMLAFIIPSLAAALPTAPDTGSDDCYNRATQTCNREYPGKNMGDKVYRDCINNLLDWCDINEPVELSHYLPVLNSQGRFVDSGLFINLHAIEEVQPLTVMPKKAKLR